MLSFVNDYCENAHEAILQRLIQTNREKKPGYGQDSYCAAAQEKIRAACACPGADVRFLVGGTQTNATVIDAVLRRYEGVIAAVSGHIAGHEAGAVEFTGHKVITLPQHEGKLSAADLRAYMEAFRAESSWDHRVQPGIAYISHPTEYGTLYTRAELEAISGVCRRSGVPLFVDGARLGYGLAADGTDVTLPVLAELADVFYIGGTKVGALFGEAVVITNPAWKRDFRYLIKQRGGMLAKGRLLGIQFEELMTEGLYTQLGRHADELAYRVRDIFRAAGYPMLFDSPTNQQFPILPDADYEVLRNTSEGEFWARVDESHSAIRFCTSWCTTKEAVDRLEAAVSALVQAKEC